MHRLGPYTTVQQAVSWIAFGQPDSLAQYLENGRRNIVRQIERAERIFLELLCKGDLTLMGFYAETWPVNRPPLVAGKDGYWNVPLIFVKAANDAAGLYCGLDLEENTFNAPTAWSHLAVETRKFKTCLRKIRVLHPENEAGVRPAASLKAVVSWFKLERLPLYSGSARPPNRDADWNACRAKFEAAARQTIFVEARNKVLEEAGVSFRRGRYPKKPVGKKNG